MEADQVDILFLTGQPGAGKTAVAKELSDLLWRIREPHAVIDLDELCRGVLPTSTADFNRSLAVANLAAIWPNFHVTGVRRVILARIIQAADDIDQFTRVISHSQVMVCLLQAEPGTIRDRIIQRDPGSNQAFLLSVTTRIAEQISSLSLPGMCVQNDQRSLNEVAREILDRAGWPSPPLT